MTYLMITRCLSRPIRIATCPLRHMQTQSSLPKVTIDKEAREAEVILPGYSYGDLDRVGNVKIWKVPLMSEASRITVYGKGDPTPPALVDLLSDLSGKLIFLGAARYEIEKDFYDRKHYYNPLRIKYQLSNFGTTSYQQYCEIHSAKTNQLLHKDYIFNVMVDIDTRRPTELTDKFKVKFQEMGVEEIGKELKPVSGLVKPENALSVSYSLEWSLTDYYYHVNQSQYVKIVHDVASRLCNENKLPSFTVDLARHNVKVLEMVYKGENVPGEVVEVFVWEISERELGFQIENRGRPVFQCRMEFYEM